MNCKNCGKTWTGPGYDGSINHACPNCGFVLDPRPTLNDMDHTMRGMPTSTMDDMSGNPLQEGVWAGIDGGWKNRMKRDESFASVKSVKTAATALPSGGVFPGYHGDVHDTLRQINQSKPGLIINGKPFGGFDDWPVPMNHTDPIEVTHPHPKVEQVATQVINDGHGGVWNEMLRRAQEKAKARMQMQPQARVAMDFDDDDVWGDDIPNPLDYGMPEGAFIIDKNGRVYKSSGQQQHDQIAARHNLQGFPRGYSSGYAEPDNPSLRLVTHENGLPPEQMHSLFQQHFPFHGPPENLAPVSNEQRWYNQDTRGVGNLPFNPHSERIQDRQLEQQFLAPEDAQQINQAEQYRGKPFGFYNNPWINRGGSVQDNRNSLYYPWSHDGSSIASDFQMHRQAFLPAIMGLLTSAGLGGTVARGVAGGLIQKAISGGPGGGMTPGRPQAPQEESAIGEGIPSNFYSSIHDEIISANSDLSDGALVQRASGDPEDVDAKEVNDGDHSEWQNDTSQGEGGTDALRPEVLQAIEEAIPNLLEFYHKEESGSQDPAIAKLLDILQQYDPELLDTPVDPQAQAALDEHTHISKIGMGVPGIGGMGMGPQQTPLMPSGNQPVNPTTQATCPHCGGLIQPGAGICSQCGGALQSPQAPQQFNAPGTQPAPGQAMGVMAAINNGEPFAAQKPCAHCGQMVNIPGVGPNNLCPYCQQQFDPQPARDWDSILQGPYHQAANQGPHSAEQMQAVIQYLQQNGQYTPEIAEDLIMHPENYGDILSQISGRPEPPVPDPDPGVPPPQPDPSMMGGQGMPAGAPPGMPMQGSWNRKLHAADNIAPKCPNCGSHTTETLVSDMDPGHFRCHNCGNSFDQELFHTHAKTADDHQQAHPDHADVQGVPAAEQVSFDDPEQDINPGSWSTTDGQPLQVGQQYEMYSARYDVPDVIKLTSIKPDGIEYVLQGEYGLEHRTAVSRQEADMDGLQFLPLNADSQAPGDPVADQLTDQLPAQPDTSQDFPMQAKVKKGMQFWGPQHEGLGQLVPCPNCGVTTPGNHPSCISCGKPLRPSSPVEPPQGTFSNWTSKLAGKKFTPMEQRDFIDEEGTARNADKLDLNNTHYVDEPSLSSIDDYFLW